MFGLSTFQVLAFAALAAMFASASSTVSNGVVIKMLSLRRDDASLVGCSGRIAQATSAAVTSGRNRRRKLQRDRQRSILVNPYTDDITISMMMGEQRPTV
jgi:hypothetical protein